MNTLGFKGYLWVIFLCILGASFEVGFNFEFLDWWKHGDLPGGTTRPKGSSHFALQEAAVLGTSTCIYLTAARNMSTSIYPATAIGAPWLC